MCFKSNVDWISHSIRILWAHIIAWHAKNTLKSSFRIKCKLKQSQTYTHVWFWFAGNFVIYVVNMPCYCVYMRCVYWLQWKSEGKMKTQELLICVCWYFSWHYTLYTATQFDRNEITYLHCHHHRWQRRIIYTLCFFLCTFNKWVRMLASHFS